MSSKKRNAIIFAELPSMEESIDNNDAINIDN